MPLEKMRSLSQMVRLARKGNDGRSTWSLHSVENGYPVYLITHNVNAAISTAADLVRNTAPYSVDGSGLTVGVWDGGAIRPTHQEFVGRVTVLDGAANDFHATHVGGTIGAAGVNASALGMAPGVLLDSYDFDSDVSEMASRAAAMPQDPGMIYLSNHSYGFINGWATGSWSGNFGPHWWGTFGDREDRKFGQYNSKAASFDSVAHSAPYYLIVKSAGNDRGNSAPGTGSTYWYLNGGSWQSKAYDPNTDPFTDPFDNGGYDTMDSGSTAKNILTIGAVNDAVFSGVRNPPGGTMSSFSGWGPTDDGRIKPDVVGNGVGVFSTDSGSDNDYTTLQGTSMSSPNVCGSAALLIDLFGNELPGQAMRSSTLKCLLIHTSTDLGNPGPDYQFGWGLIDTKTAADQILEYAAKPGNYAMSEGSLSAADASDEVYIRWDGTSTIKATIAWNDPAGDVKSGLDDTAASLVHDLDLRIQRVGGSTIHEPFILDPAQPALSATTGDNVLDNVERVFIAAPNPGVYRIVVDYKGALQESEQVYSLLVSGQADEDLLVSGSDTFELQVGGGPFVPCGV